MDDALRSELGHSEGLRQKTLAIARGAEVRAQLQQKRLVRELPALQKAAETAPLDNPDQRSAAERAYLTACQNLQQCRQAFDLARRQRIIAENL